MAFANKCWQTLESSIFEKFLNISLNISLGVKIAFLCKIYCWFNIWCYFLKDKKGFTVSTFICIMQTNEVSNLSCAKAFIEFNFKSTEGIKGIFLKVQNGFLSLQGFFIKTNNVLRPQFWLQLILRMTRKGSKQSLITSLSNFLCKILSLNKISF